MKLFVARSLRCFFLTYSVAFSPLLSAAPNELCSSALVKETTLSSLSSDDKIRIGLSFDQDSYDSLNQGASANVTVPIYGVPVGFGGTWNEAKVHQDSLKENYQFEQGSSNTNLYAQAKISEAGYAAYRDCLWKKAVGANIALENVTGDTIKVHVIYNSAVGDTTKRKVQIYALNAVLIGDQRNTVDIVGNSFDQDFTFVRTPAGSDAVVIIGSHVLDSRGVQLEAKVLDGIPKEPKLMKRDPPSLTAVYSGPQVYYNANATLGLVPVCIPQHTAGAKIVNFRVVFDDAQSNGTLWNSIPPPPPQNQGTQICTTVGCVVTGPKAGNNCAGHAHAEAQEQILGAWKPMSP